MKLYFSVWFILLLLSGAANTIEKSEKIRVLILSGSNNHEWQQTTSMLEQIFDGSELFSYDVTLRPDTLNQKDLSRYQVILSNWNSWPENDLRWPEETERALLRFIEGGGGYVTFHASSSVFYDWPEYKNISTAAWIDSTSHGKGSNTSVEIIDHNHPVTNGMAGFSIVDELWINAEVNPNFKTLAKASNEILKEKGMPAQPAVMVAEYGRGRIFHTILGHDARAMRHTGFRELLLRGTEWAARGEVKRPVPQELQPFVKTDQYTWQETDSTLALYNGDRLVWKYNYRSRYSRPFFHPVFVDRNNLTCIAPDDHPWHLGQWFCWKYINGVNYWEYEKGTFQSAGITDVKEVAVKKNDDHSAEITLSIDYHPAKGENVLREKRVIQVSEPQPDGCIWMDYEFNFEALADEVELNRTPVVGQEDGVSWGGYAGLSIRFNQDFSDSHFVTPWNDNDSINGRQGNWLYMGFNGTDGKQVGTQIMVPSHSQREGSAWYSFNDDSLPFYYYSPAYLYYKPLILKKGNHIKMNYRVLHLPGKIKAAEMEKNYQQYINQ